MRFSISQESNTKQSIPFYYILCLPILLYVFKDPITFSCHPPDIHKDGVGESIGEVRAEAAVCILALFWFWTCAYGLLSPKGVNFEGKLQVRDSIPI